MPIFGNGQMGLMPGESYGMPDQMGGFGGLLSPDKLNNPLLQIGLGILANNNSKNTAQVLGRGALQGIGNYQQGQQLAQQRKLQDYQMKDYQRKQDDYNAEQDALKDFDVKFPQYKGLARIDPKSAMKIAYPQLATNSADPYYTPIPTASGLGSFNNRSGQFQLVVGTDGQPVVKSADSPTLQGQIAGAKAGAAAGYKINTDLPGQVLTDRQVALMSDPTLGNMQPQQQMQPPIPRGTPMMPQGNFNGNPQAIMSQINRISDPQERAQATQAFQMQYGQQPAPQQAPMSNNLVGGGIRVPTAAEQAAMTTTATEQAKANVGIATDKTKNIRKADQFLSVAQQAKNILNSKDNQPTASGFGSLVDAAGGFVGVAPQGADQAAKLDTLSGWMVSNVPRMEGPQSNFDVQNYQTMAGLVGDRTKPLTVRRAALDEVIKLQEKYKALNQDGIAEEAPSPQRVRRFNPKTGKIE